MFYQSSKVFKFSTQSKDSFDLKKKNDPSPLDYQNNNYRSTTPEWKIGTSTRKEKAKDENPGPGQYDLKSSIGEGPVFKIGEVKDNNSFAHDRTLIPSNTPDPGTYDPNMSIKSSKLAFSIGKKIPENYDNKVPGPGAYDKINKSSSSPFYSIGKSPKKDNFVKPTPSPGPGGYLVDRLPGKSSAPAFKFGADDKMKQVRSTTPGPGSYEQKNMFGREGKIISFASSSKNLNNSTDVPGPGEYNPKLANQPNVKSVKLVNPSNSAAKIEKPSFPGPGNYSPEKTGLSSYKNIPKWSMGKRSASTGMYYEIDKHRSKLPAPGNYDVSTGLGEGPKFSLRGKKDVDYDNKFPGPGHYEKADEVSKDASPAWKFPSSARKDFLNTSTHSNISPGPKYMPENLKSSTGFKFSSDKKNKPIKSQTPGPGHYQIPCSIAHVPQYMVPNSKFNEEFKYV